MGKYGIGARVRDDDGDEGVIVAKRKGERRVKYEDGLPGFEVWVAKSFLTPISAPIADNDDAPAPAEQGQGGVKFKVGDRVKCADPNTPNEGVVAFMDEDILVEFKGWGDGHKGASSGQIFGECDYFWCAPDDLTLAPEWQPKVGDRVRLVKHCNAYGDDIPLHLAVGAESVITEITDALADEGITTFLLEGGGFNFYTPLNVEPLPVAADAQGAVATTDKWVPEVGQRVRCVDNNGSPNFFKVGEIYTVREVDEPAPYSDDRLVYVKENNSAMFDYRFEPAPLTIETGKFYKTRDGRKVGPMRKSMWRDAFFSESRDVTSQDWFADGSFIKGHPSRLDLVAEIVEPAAPSPKFKVGDRVRVKEGKGTCLLPDGNVYTIEDVDGEVVYVNRGIIEGTHYGLATYEADRFEPVTITTGQLVTFAEPLRVTSVFDDGVRIQFGERNFTVPASALVVA